MSRVRVRRDNRLIVIWEIRQGHALTRLRELPDESVHCVVTSPPYFGLRDYGIDGQIGLEATPDEYVARLVEVFREVRRVLRADGTLWLNIGDSYAATGTTRWPNTSDGYGNGYGKPGAWHGGERVRPGAGNAKPKDLLGIPWLLAFALRADGWYLRSDIIWAKPNPMPESVTDRPTSAHEHVFLLAKSRAYFYDADAIREDHLRTSWTAAGDEAGTTQKGLHVAPPKGSTHGDRQDAGTMQDASYHPAGRNKRNVWSIATQPYADAHFATFPPKLVEPCVLAGSSPKACGECGAPWERVTGRDVQPEAYAARKYDETGPRFRTKRNLGARYQAELDANPLRTLGWQACCEHQDDTGHSVVLDPFAGSGTVGVVCGWHGRDFLGIELSSEYAEMARRRIVAEGPLGRAASRPRALPTEHLSLFDP